MILAWAVRIRPEMRGQLEAWAGRDTRITLLWSDRKLFHKRANAVRWILRSGYRGAVLVQVTRSGVKS